MATLQASIRERSNLNSLRRSGIVPMALIQNGQETKKIQATLIDLRKTIHDSHGVGRFDITIDGEKEPRTVIVKDIERDNSSRQVLHLTLQEVHDNDMVKVDVLLIATGVPGPVDMNTAVLMNPTTHIKLRGKMKDIPESIEVDVSKLDTSTHINASDIQLPKGLELLSSADATVFSLQTLRAIEQQETAAAEISELDADTTAEEPTS